MHSKPSNVEETKRIFAFLNELCKENNIKYVFILGDLFDTHGIIHLSVVYCYYDLFLKYSDLKFYCLTGNHDYEVHGNVSKNALLSFKFLPNVKVVDDFYTFLLDENLFDFIPHCSNENFYKFNFEKKSNIVLCHHTFKGAQYENGFFAPDGIEMDNVNYSLIISGHIHKIQRMNKVFYIGSPRWLKESDSNEDRGVWLWDGENDFLFKSTEPVCRKIIKLRLDKENFKEFDFDLKNKYILEVTGDNQFVEFLSNKFSGKAEIRHIFNQVSNIKVKESDGIFASLEKFIKKSYCPMNNISNDLLWKEIQERLSCE